MQGRAIGLLLTALIFSPEVKSSEDLPPIPVKPPRIADSSQSVVFRIRPNALYSPPACTAPLFADVPPSDPFCRWIEQFFRDGITAGCGGGNFCPDNPVTRREMAVFVEAAMRGTPAWSPWQGSFRRTIVVNPVDGGTQLQNGAVLRAALEALIPSSTSRYLIKIEPGTFDVGTTPLLMKPYVDVEGSGSVTEVVRTAAGVDIYDPTIRMASNAQLRNLTVRMNTSGNASAIHIPGNVDAVLRDLYIEASGNAESWGIISDETTPSSLTASRISIVVNSATSNAIGLNARNGRVESAVVTTHSATVAAGLSYALLLEGPNSVFDLSNVDATATGSATAAAAVPFNNPLKFRGVDLTLRASASPIAYGMFTLPGCDIDFFDTLVEAAGTTTSRGLQPTSTLLKLIGSTVTASGASTTNTALRASTGTTTLDATTLFASGGTSTAVLNEGATGTVVIRGGRISGAAALSVTGTVRVGATQVEGTVANSGTLTCVHAWNALFAALGSGCT